MELVLAGGGVKVLARAAQCLARLGDGTLLLEAFAADEKLVLRALNSSHSAYGAVTLAAAAFDTFRVDGAVLQCAVLAKHVLAALKTAHAERVTLSQDSAGADFLALDVRCRGGALHKRYEVNLVDDADFLQATVDREGLAVSLEVRPRDFKRLLDAFGQSQVDITLLCRKQGAGSTQRELVLRSYAAPGKLDGGSLQTHLEVGANDNLVVDYTHGGDADAEVAVNLKDLRTMCAFAEVVDVHLVLHVSEPGSPVLVVTRVPDAHVDPHQQPAPLHDFDAEFVLATMLETPVDDSQPEAGVPVPRPGAPSEAARDPAPAVPAHLRNDDRRSTVTTAHRGTTPGTTGGAPATSYALSRGPPPRNGDGQPSVGPMPVHRLFEPTPPDPALRSPAMSGQPEPQEPTFMPPGPDDPTFVHGGEGDEDNPAPTFYDDMDDDEFVAPTPPEKMARRW